MSRSLACNLQDAAVLVLEERDQCRGTSAGLSSGLPLISVQLSAIHRSGDFCPRSSSRSETRFHLPLERLPGALCTRSSDGK